MSSHNGPKVIDEVPQLGACAGVKERRRSHSANPLSAVEHAFEGDSSASLHLKNRHRVRVELPRDASQGSAIIGELASVLADGPALPLEQDCDVDRTKPVRHGLSCSPCPHWKRAMDIVGAVVIVVLLSPVLLAIAATIKCVSRGPVFFHQRRIGVGGRPFTLWKFRTIELGDAPAMHLAHIAEMRASNRPLSKLDQRLAVIPGGRLLRALGMDELPQLLNVLRGEMSLVGPRPDVLPFENYEQWQRRRFDVLPGITGLWQVSGKNQTTFNEMMELDIEYVRRRSLLLDVEIVVKTIPALLRA